MTIVFADVEPDRPLSKKHFWWSQDGCSQVGTGGVSRGKEMNTVKKEVVWLERRGNGVLQSASYGILTC